MTLGEIFIKLGLKSESFDQGIDSAKNKTNSFGQTFSKVGVMAAGVWAAIGVGAVTAFNKIKNSTDTLSTKWEVFMGGMTSATDEFWRTLATGNWSNFFENIEKAIRIGRDYAAMLDDIEEMQRAGSMAEAKMLKENTQLEIDAANRMLSADVRRAAAEKRIANEEELAATRVKIAQKSYDNEKSITMQQTKLTSEQLEKVISDLDSVDKQRAKSYNEDYDRFIKINSSKTQVQAELAKTYTEQEILYAQAVRGMGDTTDEQLNKMVAAYMGLARAEESVLGNTRRIRMRLSALALEESKIVASGIEGEIKLLEEKLKLVTDPRQGAIIRKNIALKQEELDYLTKELSLLQSIKLSNKDISEIFTKGNKTVGTPIDTSKLVMSQDMKTGIYNSENAEKQLTRIKDFNKELNQVIASGMQSAAETFGEGIGALMSGDMDMKDFGKSMLVSIGKFLADFGKLIIAYAIAAAGLDAAIKAPGAWPIALAAGIALVAIGSAISNAGAKGISGASGSSSGTSSGSSGYANTNNQVALTGNVVFELHGTTLKGVLDNTDRKNNLIR